MKIGILTFQFAHNYGAMLQCYALKNFIARNGSSAHVINYLPIQMSSGYSMNPYWAIRRRDLRTIINNFGRINQAKKFIDFQKRMLAVGKPIKCVDDNNTSEYDAIVVGSDQVWNQDLVPDLKEFLLSNCTKCKKYAYSASLGKKEISEETLALFRKELPNFRHVSLREKNNALFLADAIGVPIQYTVDPVFLLGADEWRAVYGQGNVEDKKERYILFIDLFNSRELMDRAVKLADHLGVKIYSVDPICRNHMRGVTNLHNVGPLDYLKLIDDAEYVVTNSFHAVAFSSIFEKKLVYYLNDKLSNRILELFSAMDVDNNAEMIDFSKNGAIERYQKEKGKSVEYLKRILAEC